MADAAATGPPDTAHTHTHRERHTHTERETHTHTKRQTHTQRDRHTHKERDIGDTNRDTKEMIEHSLVAGGEVKEKRRSFSFLV